MRKTMLKPGDVLLFDKESVNGVYTFIAGKDKKLADILATLTNHRYIHAELYLGNGWIIAAAFDGVKLYKAPLAVIAKAHIYRAPITIDENKLRETVKQYFNYEYDWTALILNGIPEVLSFGNEQIERIIENWLDYTDEQKLICSELVAKFFEEQGFKIEPRGDFVTPDDIADAFERIA